MGNFYKEANFSKVLIMGFKTFYIFRGNEDLRKLTVCSVLKRKIIFQGLAEEHTSTSEHFCILTMPYLLIFSSKKLTQILRYCIRREQGKTAEEPEQSSTESCLSSTRASRASSHHSSAQDASYESTWGRHGLTGRFALWLWQDDSPFQLQPEMLLMDGPGASEAR